MAAVLCCGDGAAGDLGVSDGIPVTSPARTLVDLATELDLVAVERAVNDADKRDLIDPETLRTALDAHAGEPGVRGLRELLDRLTFRLSDSDLEIYFRPIATAAKLLPPLSKRFVNGFEVDFFWPDLGLVVETDGLRYHRTPVPPPIFVWERAFRPLQECHRTVAGVETCALGWAWPSRSRTQEG
jgi:hypothetical protein